MFKKIYASAVMFVAVFVLGISGVKASDWPSNQLNIYNNAYVSDSTVLNSKVSDPASLSVAFNSQDYVIADGKMFYSDGASAGSTIYAYSMPSLTLAWSQKYPKQVTKIVFMGGNLYFAAGNFYSVNANTGQQNWATTPGRYNNLDYSGKIYQAEDARVYGYRYYSNNYYLMVLDSQSGTIIYNSASVQNDNIADLVLSDDKIFSVAGKFNGSGSSIKSWQKSDFSPMAEVGISGTSNPRTIYDEEREELLLTASDGFLGRYRASDLSLLQNFPSQNMFRLVKYGATYYTMWGQSLKSFKIGYEITSINEETKLLPVGEQFLTDPIVVNGAIYAGTNKGRIFAKNLETGEIKYFDLETGSVVDKIIYGAGQFVIKAGFAGNSSYKKYYFYNQANLGMTVHSGNIVVESPYHTEGMNQYLGQLHCHHIPDVDWSSLYLATPDTSIRKVEEDYREKGYAFVAMTEHNLIEAGPLLANILHIQDSEEDTKGWLQNHILAIGINSPINEDSLDTQRIIEIQDQGGLPVLAHPDSWVYPWGSELMRNLPFSSLTLEAFNSANKKGFPSAYSFDKIDQLLKLGKDVRMTAGDDFTPGWRGFDGGAVMAFSASDSQADIMNALKSGNFYAVQGSKAPRINDVSLTASGINISASEVSDFKFIGKGGDELQKVSGVSSASYDFMGDEIYVRVEVESKDSGLSAWTQAFAVTKVEGVFNIDPGSHDIAFDQAVFHSNTTESVSADTLSKADYPEADPPLGYLSPVYRLQTAGQVLEGNTLSVSYAGRKVPVNTKNLSIYTYDEAERRWLKVESQVDEANQLVSASLPHYSLYALSAELPADTEAPVVDLVSPTDLTNLMGNVGFQVNASDNEAVTEVQFSMDGKVVASDLNGLDGWSAVYNTSNLITGNHKLLISAEDFAGNRAEKSYDIYVSSGIVKPTIDLYSPSSADYLYEPSNITGSFTSDLEVESIGIYLDDVFIDKAEISAVDKTFSRLMDWSQFKEGEHKLKLELRDLRGNTAFSEISITLGQNVTASIVSPPDGASYLKSKLLPIITTAVPSSADTDIYLDGLEVANNSIINLADYSFGEHTLEVRFKDKTIASSVFSVITNYSDTIKLVKQLYAEGHIKNYGITNSIIVRLELANLFHTIGMHKLENMVLHELESYMGQLNRQKKPLIDDFAVKNVLYNLDFILSL